MARAFWGTVVAPVLTTTSAGRDAWLAAVIATVAAVLFGLLVVTLGNRSPGDTVIGQSQKLLGRPVTAIATIPLVVYFLILSAAGARALGDTYSTAFMPETPHVVFVGVTVWLASIAARHGLEVLGRAAENIVWMVFLVVLGIALLPAKYAQLQHFKPILEDGLGPVLTASATTFAFFAEVVAVGLVLPRLSKPRDGARAVTWAMALGGLILVLTAGSAVAVFGDTTSTLSFPFLEQARTITIGVAIERLEILPLVLWSVMGWVKVGFYLWAAVTAASEALGLKDYRPLVYPFGFLIGALAMTGFRDIFDLLDFLSPSQFGTYGSAIPVVITVSLLLLSVIRGRAAGQQPASGSQAGQSGAGSGGGS